MIKVKIYDIIGVKSGMNHYIEAFYNLLINNGIETELKSNYIFNGSQFFPYIFITGIIKRIGLLIVSYFKYLGEVIKLKKNEFIVISVYGNIIDVPFLILSFFHKRIIVDLHEVISLDNTSSTVVRIFKFIYRYTFCMAISHSEKSDILLKEIGFKNHIFRVPLFNFKIDKNVNLQKVASEIVKAVEADREYILFFGNLRLSKGIIELLEALKAVGKQNVTMPYRVLIAGQDSTGLTKGYSSDKDVKLNADFIVRHINDDEINYLFQNCNVVLLPYKEISQSGILEMAFAFRKPIVTSSIKYFKDLMMFTPSFGYDINIVDPEIFIDELIDIANKVRKLTFYSDTDVSKYQKKEQYKAFVADLKKHMIAEDA